MERLFGYLGMIYISMCVYINVCVCTHTCMMFTHVKFRLLKTEKPNMYKRSVNYMFT